MADENVELRCSACNTVIEGRSYRTHPATKPGWMVCSKCFRKPFSAAKTADENVELRCPKCGESKHIQIRLDRWWADISEEGNYSMSCMGFPFDTDKCRCAMSEGTCEYSATVADFRPKSVRQMLLEVAESVKNFYTSPRISGPTCNRCEDTFSLGEAAMKAVKAAMDRGLDG